jgi:hypothetical protein
MLPMWAITTKARAKSKKWKVKKAHFLLLTFHYSLITEY